MAPLMPLSMFPLSGLGRVDSLPENGSVGVCDMVVEGIDQMAGRVGSQDESVGIDTVRWFQSDPVSCE
jgi:hypothetical protein